MSNQVSRTRTTGASRNDRSLSGSILRKSRNGRHTIDNPIGCHQSSHHEDHGVSWNCTVKSFQAKDGSTRVREELFDANELDAGIKQTSPFAEQKDVPEETGPRKAARRYSSFDSFGLSLDESGIKDIFDDSDRDGSINQKAVQRSSLGGNMQRTLSVLGSFGADNNQVPDAKDARRATKRPSLLHRAYALGTRRQQEPRSASDSRSPKKRGSLSVLNMVISVRAKSSSNVGDVPMKRATGCCADQEAASSAHPSNASQCRAKKRSSLVNMVNAIKQAVTDMGLEEDCDVDKTLHQSKPRSRTRLSVLLDQKIASKAKQGRKSRHPSKQDPLMSSISAFDKVASERFSTHGSLLTHKSASTSTFASSEHNYSDESLVDLGGERSYNAKIASMLYSKQ